MEYLIDSNFWGYPSVDSYSRINYQFVIYDGGKILKIFMPGAKKEDIVAKVQKDNYLCVEYQPKGLGQFIKWFRLDDNIVIDKIKAEYINGILQITLPEKESFTKIIPIA